VSVILGGRFVQDFPSRSCDCPPDTVLAKPSGERHVDRWFAAPTQHLIIEFETDAAQKLGACGAVVERIHHGRHPVVASLARRMVEEMERPDDVTATILEGLALEALSRLHRGNRRDAGSSGAPQWLCTIREYLHDRFRGPIRLDALALEVGLHADHVSRVFADRFGCSVGEYLRALRIDAALCELATTETPLAQVAHRCGFSDQSHLTRLVRRETGQTPRQYRAAHRKMSPPEDQVR
jgi:AraC family transcriptional regulator